MGIYMPILPLRCLVSGVFICMASISSAATPLLATNPSELARTVLGPLPGTAVVGVLQADRANDGAAGAQADQGAQLRFEIGSISKVFTGLLLAQAVERGELKLDATLGSLKLTKTALPPRVASITLRQLVTHTSCLPNDPNDIAGDTSMAETLKRYPRARLWSALATQQLDHDGPCTAQYSNLGFAVLGEALAAHYRTSWEQLVYRRITKPLGMSDTGGPIGDKADRLAAAYADGKPAMPLLEWGAFAGAGGLHSSLKDMLAFSRALLAGRKGPLGAAAERVLQPLYGSQIAYAIDMRGPATRRTFSKDGRTGGFSSYWTILPDTHEALVVLASNADARINGLSRKLLAQRYPVPQPVAGSSSNLSQYAGVYRIHEGSAFTFVAQDGQLYGRLTGQRFSQMLPAGGDTYVLPGADAAFVFTREDGHIRTVIMRQLGVETLARRTEEAPPSVARLDTATQQEYGGRYQGVAPDEKIGYTVQAQGGQLEIKPDGERRQVIFPQEGQSDTFRPDIVPVSYRFQRDATGAVSGLIVQRDGRSIHVVRAE